MERDYYLPKVQPRNMTFFRMKLITESLFQQASGQSRLIVRNTLRAVVPFTAGAPSEYFTLTYLKKRCIYVHYVLTKLDTAEGQ